MCKGFVWEVVSGAMKRELMERKETEQRGVVVELYTRLLTSERKLRPAAAAPPIRSQLSGLTRASMMWPHLSLLRLHDDAAVPGSCR